jgi:outer membrane protein TolC
MLALLLVLVAQAAPPKGLGLRELQERARRNDPRAMQAVAQLENVRGKHDEAAWAFFPTFQVTAYIAGPTPERRLLGGDNDPEPANPAHLTPGTLGENWLRGKLGITAHADVQTVFPLWTFGKLTAGKEALGHLVNATEALLQRARDQAAFDVARAYWGYQTARNADDSVRKVRDRLKDAQQTAQKLLAEKSEQISRSDAGKLDYLAEEIEAQHAGALKNRDLALTGLRLLVGAQPGEELSVALQDLPEAPQPPNGDELLRRALQQRPETRAANEAVGGRKALVDLARARLWPDVGLAGGIRFTETTNASNPPSPFVNNPYHESSGYIGLGLQGTFDVPQKLARLRQAQADLHEAVAMQLGAQQLVRLEVQQALGDLAEARVRVQRYGKETQIGKQLATQAGVAFDSGLGDARELLEGTLLYARADGERLKALYDAQLAWAALEKAAGAQLSP